MSGSATAGKSNEDGQSYHVERLKLFNKVIEKGLQRFIDMYSPELIMFPLGSYGFLARSAGHYLFTLDDCFMTTLPNLYPCSSTV